MKYIIFCALFGFPMFATNNRFANADQQAVVGKTFQTGDSFNDPATINFQESPGSTRMRSIAFKSRKYCRVVLKDFEYDVRFRLLGATVYFSGANFPQVQKGYLTSVDLKPIANLMERCGPGSIVTFDDIKVIGPDNYERYIAGLTLTLY
jgi:hypothetical protein